MGNAPPTCNNRYGGTFTSFTISYPGGTLDALAHPNSTFDIRTGSTYNVTFVVHTASQSVNNNTLGGTLWYGSNYPGFGDGICYPSQNASTVGPGQDVTIAIAGVSHPANFAPNASQSVYFTISFPQQITYNVVWSIQASTTAGSSSTAQTSSTSDGTSLTASATLSSTSSSSTTASSSVTGESSTSSTLTSSSGAASSSQIAEDSSRSSLTSTSQRSGSQGGPLPTPGSVLAYIGIGIVVISAASYFMFRRLR